jgi:hypothetical protein
VGLVIVYAATCEEMFCQFVIALAGLPWILLLSQLINLDDLSLGGWVVVTLVSVILNITILYILLSGGGREDSGRGSGVG